MLAAISCQFGFTVSPLEAKTRAMLGALQWAWELGFDALEVEIDSLQVMEALRKGMDFNMS